MTEYFNGGVTAADLASILMTPVEEVRSGSDKDLVHDWLVALHGLSGVPFHYLVPDTRMLPIESIRFFNLDMNWLNALADGALSIGGPRRSNFSSQMKALKQAALAAVRSRRHRIMGLPPLVAATESEAPKKLSGFLLRSAAVAGWPGMELRAFSDAAGTFELKLVRLERLTPALLFGLFEGALARVDFCQPAETLFFGAKPSGQGAVVRLRYCNDAVGKSAGTSTGGEESIPVRPLTWSPTGGADGVAMTTGNGTLRMAKFAGAIESKVWTSADPKRKLTSAEFGLQLAQTAETVTFRVTSG